MGETRQHGLLLLLCLSGLVARSSAMVFWTANVDLKYVNADGEFQVKSCVCGLYGRHSVLMEAKGVVALPVNDPEGCAVTYNRSASSPPWVALVQRGNCSFSMKILTAARQNAAAVVVYNSENTTGIARMDHPEARGAVAVMISHALGSELARLVANGSQVTLSVAPGSPHGLWMDSYWLYFLSIAFLIVTAASVTYFVFLSASRLYGVSAARRAERRLKAEAKGAIGRLRVRTLRRGDEETASDAHVCAVCIEAYRAGEVVTVLTCDHLFHKACIEPWLLERRTCPMCKCDILKALGVEEPAGPPPPPPTPPEATVVTVTGGDALYEVPLTDPAGRDPDRHPHRYDNRAFEGESEEARA